MGRDMTLPPDKPELLMPAGDMDRLRIAIRYGADAVYIGGESFSLREKAANFSGKELAEAVEYAHDKGSKVYVAANIIPHDSDLRKALAPFYASEAAPAGPAGSSSQLKREDQQGEMRTEQN